MLSLHAHSACVVMIYMVISSFLLLLFQIYIVYNKRTGKPRGYAFIEYEHERDMHCEYQYEPKHSFVS